MSFSLAWQRLESGTLIFLPLCPSTNDRMQPVRMGARCREVLTKEAREYIRSVGITLRLWARSQRIRPARLRRGRFFGGPPFIPRRFGAPRPSSTLRAVERWL